MYPMAMCVLVVLLILGSYIAPPFAVPASNRSIGSMSRIEQAIGLHLPFTVQITQLDPLQVWVGQLVKLSYTIKNNNSSLKEGQLVVSFDDFDNVAVLAVPIQFPAIGETGSGTITIDAFQDNTVWTDITHGVVGIVNVTLEAQYQQVEATPATPLTSPSGPVGRVIPKYQWVDGGWDTANLEAYPSCRPLGPDWYELVDAWTFPKTLLENAAGTSTIAPQLLTFYWTFKSAGFPPFDSHGAPSVAPHPGSFSSVTLKGPGLDPSGLVVPVQQDGSPIVNGSVTINAGNLSTAPGADITYSLFASGNCGGGPFMSLPVKTAPLPPQ